MFELMDHMCAERLGVSVDEYIEKIEKTTLIRADVIVMTLLNTEDEKIIEKVRRIFKLIS